MLVLGFAVIMSYRLPNVLAVRGRFWETESATLPVTGLPSLPFVESDVCVFVSGESFVHCLKTAADHFLQVLQRSGLFISSCCFSVNAQ